MLIKRKHVAKVLHFSSNEKKILYLLVPNCSPICDCASKSQAQTDLNRE